MSPAWKDYQKEATSFFQSLGFDSKMEEVVEGVRGKHKVDVWVTGKLHGIPFRWVVECKDWKTNVPKEKVMALLSIIQDVGADRGFLLSETGFQSGAIRAVRDTNITLTNLIDLKDVTNESLQEKNKVNLNWRLYQLKKRLSKLHKETGDYFSEYMELKGRIMFIDLALDDAIHGNFPTVYEISNSGQRLEAFNCEDFFEKTTELLDSVEIEIKRILSQGE